MSSKIIISSEEEIVCPHCSKQFVLHEGITRSAIEKHEHEFEDELKKQSKEIEGKITRELEKDITGKYNREIQDLQDQLNGKNEDLEHLKSQISKAKDDAKKKAEEEYKLELDNLKEELGTKNKAITEFRENELALRKEKQQLEEDKQNLDLEIQRKLDEERKVLLEQTSKSESEKFELKEAEYKKKLDDAQKANKDLTRKLEQSSQQLKGEVLELELEDILKEAFPEDVIEPVKKGARGADVIQKVMTKSGMQCGIILWEAKRAENWTDKWVQKLKDDQLSVGAEVAAIISTILPKDIQSFASYEEIWVADYKYIKPLSQALRLMLLETYKLKIANTGKSEKMELLYNYLNSPQFAQKIRSVVETFINMKSDLDKERNSIMRQWKKRETQIERVALSMTGIIGELQGIAHDTFDQLDDISQLALPESTD